MRLILLFILIPFVSLLGQSNKSKYKLMMDNKQDYTLEEIEQAIEQEYKDKDKGKGTGYKQLRRWISFNEPRLDNKGKLLNLAAVNHVSYSNYLSFLMSPTDPYPFPDNYDPGGWAPVGPISTTASNFPGAIGGNKGIGRVNRIEFVDSSCFLATPAGGLWKASGYWNNFEPLTDGLPSIGLTDVTLDNDNIWILTGSGGESYIDPGFFGILKSEDGGSTWQTTSVVDTNAFSNSADWEFSYKMKRDPDNALKQLATIGYTVLITYDGWDSYSERILEYQDTAGTIKISYEETIDIEFHPQDSSIIYVSSKRHLFRSDDGGATFNVVTNGLPIDENNTRIEIAVSADEPDWVYLIYGYDQAGANPGSCDSTSSFNGLYRSTNSGVSFSLRSIGCPNILGASSFGDDNRGQNAHDLAIAVNPNNANDLYVGAINIWRSIDGGATFNNETSWDGTNPLVSYVHADIHDLQFSPSGKLWCANDGGFYMRRPDPQSGPNLYPWEDRSDNLQITQYYNISVASLNGNTIVVGGTQDNGTRLLDCSSGNASPIDGGDGFDCIIDNTHSDKWYTTWQEGIKKHTYGGSIVSDITMFIDPTMDQYPFWECVFKQHPTDDNILYITTRPASGFKGKLFKSTDQGGSWNVIKYGQTGEKFLSMSQGVSNPDVIYLASRDNIYFTNNGGTSWSNITPDSVQILNLDITSVNVNPDNELEAWITFGGYDAKYKVFWTGSAGSSWWNIGFDNLSNTNLLPNVPMNCMAIAPGAGSQSYQNSKLYLGSDVGVFYYDYDINTWVPYFHGLPNVIINDLEILYSLTDGHHLYAGTFGRGVWRSKLYGNCVDDWYLTESNYTNWGLSYSNMSQYYAAKNSISSSRTIYSSISDSVTYKAGDSIMLLENFNTQDGAIFKAILGPCDNSSNNMQNNISSVPSQSISNISPGNNLNNNILPVLFRTKGILSN